MGYPVVGYDVDGLRRGQQLQTEAATRCVEVSRTLGGIAVAVTMFGDVPAAVEFCASTMQVRDGQVRDSDAEQARRADLAERGGTVAGMGEELTGDTADVARSATTTVPPPGTGGR